MLKPRRCWGHVHVVVSFGRVLRHGVLTAGRSFRPKPHADLLRRMHQELRKVGDGRAAGAVCTAFSSKAEMLMTTGCRLTPRWSGRGRDKVLLAIAGARAAQLNRYAAPDS